MTVQTYILCALAGLLGIAFHLFAIKIPSAQTRAKVANLKFTVGDFFSTEIAGISSSIFTVAIVLICAGEWLRAKPEFSNWVITGFAFIGFTGSSVLLAAFNKVGTVINKAVDIKTDIADEKISAAQGAAALQNNPISNYNKADFPATAQDSIRK
jgi:hypothetical protein